jgi:hypothetical protein
MTLRPSAKRRAQQTPRLVGPVLRAVPPKVLHIEPRINQPVEESINSNCPNPYVDYSRILTAEGGILLTFKAIDDSFLLSLRRLFLWVYATGTEVWFVMHFYPGTSLIIKIVCLVVAGFINWLIVAKPVEIMRSIEIRPDCLIFDGRDLFRRQHFENNWPSLQSNGEGAFVFAGTYGTRYVEFFTLTRFDEHDRAPEVLGAHLTDAMKQLWLNAI